MNKMYYMKNNISYSIASRFKANQIALAHISIFKDYFFSNLGVNALNSFYLSLIEDEDSFVIIAEKEDNVIGLLAVTMDSKKSFSNYYKKSYIELSKNLITQIIKGNKIITKGVWKRRKNISFAISSLFFHKKNISKKSDNNESSNIKTRLLSIGILSEYRGIGVADELLSFCKKILEDKGINEIGLTTNVNNIHANNLYKRNGWNIEKQEDEIISYFTRF